MKDDNAIQKKAHALGVDWQLLKREYEIAEQLTEAKREGDITKVADLTKQLIEVQKQQPQVGPSFG